MPPVTVTVREGRSGEFKTAVLEAVHQALGDLMSALVKSPGLNPGNLMVCFKDTQWQNGSCGGGRLLHA